MKKRLLILKILILLLVSCHNEETRNNEVTITGKVNNSNYKNIELYLIYSQPGTKSNQIPLQVDSTGKFNAKLNSSIPLDAFILDKKSFANIHFIYHPKDSIYIEFTAKEKALDLLKTVHFKADRHKTNNLLIDFQILREEHNLGYGAIKPNSYAKNVDDFISEMDSVKLEQLRLVNQFKENNVLDTEVEKWINSFALETYYYFLDDYAFGKKNIPSDYFNYNNEISNITLSDITSWKNLSARINSYSMNIVNPFIRKKIKDAMMSVKDEKINIDSLAIEYIKQNTKNGLLTQLLISHNYTSQFKSNLLEGYENNQNLINTSIKLPIIKENLYNYYKEVLSFIKKPNVYTSEVLVKMENTPIEKTFSEILSKNEGKVIYIDIWATWCSPCIKAMPDSKKLMEKFKGKEVSFVYICIESKEILWKRLISEFNLGGGQHYLMDKNQSIFFRKTLDVQGLPQYFIIDKKGNIVEKGKDIHPKNKITEEKIKSRLKATL